MAETAHASSAASSLGSFADIGVERSGHVATIEIRRPPNNFFDIALIEQIGDALDLIDADTSLRAVVLGAQGKSFCAGANFNDPARQNEKPTSIGGGQTKHLYEHAVRLFANRKPIVAAVQGAAIGGGLGLALVADFRVTCPEARFSANFTRLGFHPGFGLTATLPELIGKNRAELMFYTGRRIGGEEALAWGLANALVPLENVRAAALKNTTEIDECAPLALIDTRATMRAGLAGRVKEATAHELVLQNRLRDTEDFKEGVKAASERRVPDFKGR